MKRRDGTLYEVARDRLGHSGQTGRQRPAPPGDDGEVGLRFPPGLLALAALSIVIVGVVIWWAGSWADAAIKAPPVPAGQAQPPGEIIDPLKPLPEAPQEQADPRSVGKWYFVLAETRPEGARRLAAFCRAQGLDAAVVSGHNARLERVVALPGLDSASTTTDAYRRLDERIRDVGRRWKAQGDTTDLSDRYLDRWKTQP